MPGALGLIRNTSHSSHCPQDSAQLGLTSLPVLGNLGFVLMDIPHPLEKTGFGKAEVSEARTLLSKVFKEIKVRQGRCWRQEEIK